MNANQVAKQHHYCSHCGDRLVLEGVQAYKGTIHWYWKCARCQVVEANPK